MTCPQSVKCLHCKCFCNQITVQYIIKALLSVREQEHKRKTSFGFWAELSIFYIGLLERWNLNTPGTDLWEETKICNLPCWHFSLHLLFIFLPKFNPKCASRTWLENLSVSYWCHFPIHIDVSDRQCASEPSSSSVISTSSQCRL